MPPKHLIRLRHLPQLQLPPSHLRSLGPHLLADKVVSLVLHRILVPAIPNMVLATHMVMPLALLLLLLLLHRLLLVRLNPLLALPNPIILACLMVIKELNIITNKVTASIRMSRNLVRLSLSLSKRIAPTLVSKEMVYFLQMEAVAIQEVKVVGVCKEVTPPPQTGGGGLQGTVGSQQGGNFPQTGGGGPQGTVGSQQGGGTVPAHTIFEEGESTSGMSFDTSLGGGL